MKIFVTGGTGFIGRYLVQRLSQTEHELVCLARRTSDTTVLRAAGAEIVIGDLLDKASLKAGMQGCDWVVNLASSFLFWVPDRTTYREVNVSGTRNLMESALETRAAKVVHVSTGAVYGNAAWPITEASLPGEDCPSEYARTKREGDELAWQLYREAGLALVVIYPSAVVGADDPKAAGRYLRNVALERMPGQVLVDSSFPWVYVGDVCEAILRALEKEDNIGERYLVSGCNHTWGEINELIAEIAGAHLPRLRLPDPLTRAGARVLTWVADVTKKPPLLDLSVDQVALMRQGFVVDGSKAARELGFTYTPIRAALEEALSPIIAERAVAGAQGA